MAARFTVETVFKMVDKVVAPVTRMQNRVSKFTRSMSKGLNKANRSLKKVIKGLKRGAAVALKFGGVAVAAGFAAVAVAINRVAGSADNLAKITARLKFPIEEFQEWRFVAEQSGLTTQEFDKSIGTFTKAVGEARAGTGTLITILKKSNPELLKQIKAADSVAGAFGLYLNALRETENQLDKTAIAVAGFGRKGAKFLNITKQSAKEIEKLRKEMKENGVVTKEQAAAAEAYNDATNSLKLALSGLLNNVILPMLPKITETVKAWRAWIISNKDLLTSGIVGFFLSVKNSVLDVFESLKKLNAEQALVERLKNAVTFLGDAFALVVKHAKTILRMVGAIILLSLTLKAATVVMVAYSIATKAAAFAFGLLSKVMRASPVGLLITLFASVAALIIANWEPVSDFFKNLWANITGGFKTVRSVAGALGSLFGFGDDDKPAQANQGVNGAGAANGQLISPSDRVARGIEETRNVNTSEVTIMDQTGRATVTRGKLGSGIQLQPSGAM